MNHGKAGVRKLAAPEVRYIRRMDRTGERTRKDMAREFGLNPEVLARICRGETYREVGEAAGDIQAAESVQISAETTQELARQQRKLAEMQAERGEMLRKKQEYFKGKGQDKTPEEIAQEAQDWADAQDRQVIAGLPKAEGA